MTKDHTQLAIENGAKGLNRGIVYFEEIAEFNATIEAAIKQAFDEYDAFVRYKELFIHMRDNDLTEEYSAFVSNRLNHITQHSLETIVGNDIINGTSTSLILTSAIDTAIGEKK